MKVGRPLSNTLFLGPLNVLLIASILYNTRKYKWGHGQNGHKGTRGGRGSKIGIHTYFLKDTPSPKASCILYAVQCYRNYYFLDDEISEK